jgi:hypothetical protein
MQVRRLHNAFQYLLLVVHRLQQYNQVYIFLFLLRLVLVFTMVVTAITALILNNLPVKISYFYKTSTSGEI